MIKMNSIFSPQDRQNVLDYIVNSHFIQYSRGFELYESGTNLVQKEGVAGEPPFSAAFGDCKKFDPGRRQ